MPPIRRIAILVAASGGYSRAVREGISGYARPFMPWVFHFGLSTEAIIPRLKQWKIDGIIASLNVPDVAAALIDLGQPLVNITTGDCHADVVSVQVDLKSVGVAAARHLLESGFNSYGYCTEQDRPIYQPMQRAFEQTIHAADTGKHYSSIVCKERIVDTFGEVAWPSMNQQLITWLRDLPKPAAVFACHDPMAAVLCDVCRAADMRVPDDVAILGQGNDALVCQSAFPPLSSVNVPGQQVGFIAARNLDAMMRGEQPQHTHTLLPAVGIEARQSTDLTATDDQYINEAIRYIRQFAHTPINVEDVLRVVPLSRRSLEKKFRQRLGRSPLEQIRKSRMERACHLLLETKLNIHEIAINCGLNSASRLSKIFQQSMGCSPTAYRKRQRAGVTT